jgi:hypothetical protein
MVVRSSALRAGRPPCSPRKFVVLISARGRVRPRFSCRRAGILLVDHTDAVVSVLFGRCAVRIPPGYPDSRQMLAKQVYQATTMPASDDRDWQCCALSRLLGDSRKYVTSSPYHSPEMKTALSADNPQLIIQTEEEVCGGGAIGTGCRHVVSSTLQPLCPLGKSPQNAFEATLIGLQSRSGHCREKDILRLSGIEPLAPSSDLVAIPTELSRLRD